MSKLVLGTVQMGIDYGVNNCNGKISDEESYTILSKAYSSGITTLDTAEVYGDAHRIIGTFHKKNPNKKFDIITKIPFGIDQKFVEVKIKNYLNELKVNRLEVLMFHSFESFINNPEALDVLIDLKLHGIVNHIGVSVYTNKQLEYLINEEAITVVQLPFNLLDNISIRGDLIKQLKVKGKIIHTRSAFLQGLFFKNLDDQNKIVQKLYPQIKILKQITIQTNCLMEELALAYCIQQDNIDNVIIGVDSINHLEANLKAANFCIEEETMKTLDAINVNDINLLNPSLWQSKQF